MDLVERYASLLPATVIAEILGAPVAMRRQFLEWGAGAALSLEVGLSYRDFRRAEYDLAALHRWMLNHFAEIRRAPRDDVLSALVTAHDEGGQLTRRGFRDHGQPAGKRRRPAAAPPRPTGGVAGQSAALGRCRRRDPAL